MGDNWQFSRIKGREKRLEAELNAHQTGVNVPSVPPLFSHCATMQAFFVRGWNSVTACDIRLHCGIGKTQEATDLLTEIRRFKQCHFR